MKNNQKVSGVALVVAVMVILGIAAGIYWYLDKKTEIETTTTTDQSSEWKTYKSIDFGFQLAYPSTWNLENTDPAAGVVTLSKESAAVGFFDVGKSYVSIYPNGRPGSGMPSLNFEQGDIALSEQTNPATIVRLENGEVAAMSISFKNPPEKNANTEMYVGIRVENVEYACISDTTRMKIPEDRCFSGYQESGVEYGTYQISGSLNEREKREVYAILESFSFLR